MWSSGARKAKLPAFVAPQLATLVKEPPAGDLWLHELKFDGYRLEVVDH
jgi:bifunctional non-homologous end joining protein LigD